MTVNGQQYAYDVNGNMTKDLSRSIQSVEYNMLNLPRQITFSDGSTITNMYDADGRKLRTTRNIVIGGTTTSNVTDYCGINKIVEKIHNVALYAEKRICK